MTQLTPRPELEPEFRDYEPIQPRASYGRPRLRATSLVGLRLLNAERKRS